VQRHGRTRECDRGLVDVRPGQHDQGKLGFLGGEMPARFC
jgi:hypothetical protein